MGGKRLSLLHTYHHLTAFSVQFDANNKQHNKLNQNINVA